MNFFPPGIAIRAAMVGWDVLISDVFVAVVNCSPNSMSVGLATTRKLSSVSICQWVRCVGTSDFNPGATIYY